ncbi:protein MICRORCHIDIA 2-like [Triticum dicoccoides]|uniref:protein MICRORCHIDIA 2-like n=1 Tax=Triticum dicoccoides TaxID=85692 RepID=UPI0018910C72|nr:protein MICRORCHIDIA 2-like [Triticum dicoccoides]
MTGGTAGVGGSGRSPGRRSLWKAGTSEAPSVPIREFHDRGLRPRLRSPRFLGINPTSHKLAFGAISELLDNAVDEVCNIF